MNKKDKENKKKDNSTITFGRLQEVMQEESDLQRKKRGLPPEKIEPLISDKPEMKIKITNAKKPEEQQKVRRFFKNVIALVIVFILIAILVNTT
tara:strand:+ start:254 stop:535 length:282 start_codon:yes stop_codon:yes gene_type:complete